MKIIVKHNQHNFLLVVLRVKEIPPDSSGGNFFWENSFFGYW